MKNKRLWNVLLVAVLAFALGLGSMALYVRAFSSKDNPIRTARFDVNTDGTLDGDSKFGLVGEDLYPGVEAELYSFEIHKGETEVDVEYFVSVIPKGKVFESQDIGGRRVASPLDISLLKAIDGQWEEESQLQGIEIPVPEDIEKFKINLKWPHNDDTDIYFEGLEGAIDIKVEAKQKLETEEPEDPEEPQEPTIKVRAYMVGGDLINRYIDVEVENIEGADQFQIEYKVGDINPTTKITEITKIGAPRDELPAINRRVTKGDIRIYDQDENLLYEFKSVELVNIFPPKQ